LELFKIWDRIWIKNQGSFRVWNSIEFEGIWLEFSSIDEIWLIDSWLYLDDTLTHERNLEIQIHEFVHLLQGFDSNSFEFFYSSLLRVGLPMNLILD
jgi:hypothetical protein